MKLKSIRIEINDDGTFQVECFPESSMMCCGKTLKYSAKTIDEALSKIDIAKKEFEGMKSDDKEDKGNGKNDVVKEFMDGEED